ncbi:hypothetical protein BDY17DRAFT_321598 [Neohortaea acidophila]|uniref:BTB domain-containing protein n=1 Tax=Neohortaea acidophila TaxID=245834 RepID=A0A6A6Q5Z9_9PEZI|nr:uncharacterized protein BDY17DRAFT_321598 [Neohortaea acidophila]KAF2486837.1 hypothetical protein BDY17DRAFT_321598 [Neohortaea acidophila]
MANLNDPRADQDSSTMNFQASIIKVVVGTDKYTYRVHKSYLTKPGSFFETALKKPWIKGHHRTIELPEDDPYDFHVYVQWLYTGKLFCKPLYEQEPETEERNYGLLFDLYVLGQKLLDREFQDRVVDATIAASHDTGYKESSKRLFPSDGVVDSLYRRTSKGCPMRRLLIDLSICQGGEGWMVPAQNDPDGINVEFLIDLATAFYKIQADDTIMDKLEELDEDPGCEYHHHGKDEECGSYGGKKIEAL